MPDTERAQRLLALFTSPECAEGIAGDLAESRDGGSPILFWQHVLATMVALWASAFSRAPLATLSLLIVGCGLFLSSALSGVVVLSLFPQHIGSMANWIVLPSLWWAGALCTGVLLVGVAPVRGMAACVALALTAEALLMAFGVTVSVPHSEILMTPKAVFYSSAMLAPLPLLAGGVRARLRLVARNNQTLEQQR